MRFGTWNVRSMYIEGSLTATTRKYGMITLRWIFRKWVVGVWTGPSWLRIGTGGGHF
jgi:hypothetical protein